MFCLRVREMMRPTINEESDCLRKKVASTPLLHQPTPDNVDRYSVVFWLLNSQLLYFIYRHWRIFNMYSRIFIIYRPGARGIRRNISRSDDIFRGALPRGKYHHWGKCYAESPERRVYKWYIIPKVKELTKFSRLTCWILTTRIQFLISYVYLSFWRFLFKRFEHVSFGSLKVTYVLKIFV
jgi:hypothetical protein